MCFNPGFDSRAPVKSVRAYYEWPVVITPESCGSSLCAVANQPMVLRDEVHRSEHFSPKGLLLSRGVLCRRRLNALLKRGRERPLPQH